MQRRNAGGMLTASTITATGIHGSRLSRPRRSAGMTIERHARSVARLATIGIGATALKIGILRGDDIGLEVVPECVKVMKQACLRAGLSIDWTELPIGKAGHDVHGHTLPAVT